MLQTIAAAEAQERAFKDPRRLVAEALRYRENKQRRMVYPRDRQEALPVPSSLVESLVGEFHARVKSREKFWNRPAGGRGDAPVARRCPERGRPSGVRLRHTAG